MSNSNDLNGPKINGSKDIGKCKSCAVGKLTRVKIPKFSTRRPSSILGVVYSDVCGPIDPPSQGGARCFVTFIDNFSERVTMYTISAKSDVFKNFPDYHAYSVRQVGKRLKVLHTENGGEYMSIAFQAYLKTYGIFSRRACVKTPEQYGVDKRMKRTLLKMVQTMLEEKSVSKTFCAEAISTVVFIINRITSSSLPTATTPHEGWLSYNQTLRTYVYFALVAGTTCNKLKESSKVEAGLQY